MQPQALPCSGRAAQPQLRVWLRVFLWDARQGGFGNVPWHQQELHQPRSSRSLLPPCPGAERSFPPLSHSEPALAVREVTSDIPSSPSRSALVQFPPRFGTPGCVLGLAAASGGRARSTEETLACAGRFSAVFTCVSSASSEILTGQFRSESAELSVVERRWLRYYTGAHE